MSSGYLKTFSLTLAAPSANAIATAQTLGGAGNLTINGALASGGIATLSPPQRVGIGTVSDNSGRTFTITGTGGNGLTQSETIVGPATGSVNTTKDFATVTRISVSGALTGNVTAGTVGIASTQPLIVDRFVNPSVYGAALVISGSVTSGAEISYDDFAPAWNLNSNSPTWFSVSDLTGSSNKNGTIAGPITMVRMTNTTGTGTATLTFITPYKAA